MFNFKYLIVMKYSVNEGDKFGKFTVIKKVKHITAAGNVEWRWECTDEYGELCYKRARALYQEAEKHNQKIEKAQNAEYYEKMGMNQMGLRKHVFREYIRNAANRDIPMNLKFEEFNELIGQNCYYCGAEPIVHESLIDRSNKSEPMLKHNGIDRLDSSIGYEKDNCVPCCYICNRAKAQLGTKEFLAHIKKIYDYRIIREGSTTISKESTSETIADGNGVSPTDEESDIV
jgi:hypothetical protein